VTDLGCADSTGIMQTVMLVSVSRCRFDVGSSSSASILNVSMGIYMAAWCEFWVVGCLKSTGQVYRVLVHLIN
jgi:hypothetical protein